MTLSSIQLSLRDDRRALKIPAPGRYRRLSPSPPCARPAISGLCLRACRAFVAGTVRRSPVTSPHPRLRRDTHALLPAAPTPPAPSQGYPCTSAGSPRSACTFAEGYPCTPCRHPRPACTFAEGYPCTPCRHPRPAPPAPPLPRGRGPCVAIPGGKPCPGLSRLIPMQWTVVDIAIGGEADGEGGHFPPPLSPDPNPPIRRQPLLC